ncbi:MAG: hypothetical protein ACLFVB_10190, partial [Thermoplasmata archaeon]
MKLDNNIFKTLLSSTIILFLILSILGSATNLICEESKTQNRLADSPWPRWKGNNQGTGLSPYNTSFVDEIEKWNITIDGSIKSQPVIG